MINKTAEFVREFFNGKNAGHDWWHMKRVWHIAKEIAAKEGGNKFVIEMAALLHDIDDLKLSDDPTRPNVAKEWLLRLDLGPETRDLILTSVDSISFKGAKVKTQVDTIEAMVVQDADRLDAIGAIGVARVFAYGEHVGHAIYNPDVKPVLHSTFEEYRTNGASSINHFYEKLLLLKDRMNTRTGKRIAEKRHEFLEVFLKQFFLEWKGKDVNEE